MSAVEFPLALATSLVDHLIVPLLANRGRSIPLAAVDIGLRPAHLVGIGGAIGAVFRHWVYLHAPQDRFPTATLLVNVGGSFVFGLLTFLGAGESAVQFLGIGICGSFTTFSTFSVETVDRWDAGERHLAVMIAVTNLVLALTAIALAWMVVASIR